MAGERRKSWRELCVAALDAKDPDELLQILQELNRVLKHEEQVRHDFRNAKQTVQPYEHTREHRPT
jgi:mannitol/fructose-specific phosphotransferase system IIA component (Ntr-type)